MQPLVERVLEKFPDHTPDEIRASLEAAEAQLWVAYRDGVLGVVITRVRQGLRKYVQIWIGAGEDGDSWIDEILAHIEAWAKEIECDEVRITGRRGWKKRLPEYEERAIILAKAI